MTATLLFIASASLILLTAAALFCHEELSDLLDDIHVLVTRLPLAVVWFARTHGNR